MDDLLLVDILRLVLLCIPLFCKKEEKENALLIHVNPHRKCADMAPETLIV